MPPQPTAHYLAESKKSFLERGIVSSLNPLRDKYDYAVRVGNREDVLVPNEYIESRDNTDIPAGLNV